ncbi:MAG: ABC transporter permease subunit [Chloroflexi bacterium]|nr:ABC transporter permease subunit [Chloroflexota bacterium]
MARGIGITPGRSIKSRMTREMGTFIMVLVILSLSVYLILPMVVLFIFSFDVSRDAFVGPREWGLSNWTTGFKDPRILEALWNSFRVWFLVMIIAFPVSIAISLLLARTRLPFSHRIEFMFWVAFMFPGLASTVGWMMMLDPRVGFINVALTSLPFIDKGPFNIFSLEGIVFARLMADGIAYKVILFTPAFRNMDQAMEEAGRVSGASKVMTLLRVTLPVMAAPLILIFSLQLIRIFQGFEVEWLLGARWGFFVYSTLIYQMTTQYMYGPAVVLASMTLMIIGVIFPLQRWVTRRRHYTTITGSFKPGLLDLGKWKWPFFSGIVLLLLLLTALPILVLIVGSFMSFVGFFNATPTWTLDHWQRVFSDELFLTGLKTTLILATTAGLASPILFSIIAYLIVRSKWRLRSTLDSIIWISAAFPGILSALGLLVIFLSVPGLTWLYGSIWALILVVVISGNTTGTNIFKGVLVQLGADLEEAGRVSGAGWFKTYVRIVIPVLMPTMILIGMLNFISAASTTSSIILLSSRDTVTLSLLALEWASSDVGQIEASGIVNLVIMGLTMGLALIARAFGLRVGLKHEMKARDRKVAEPIEAPAQASA